jgi:hypothetical protein
MGGLAPGGSAASSIVLTQKGMGGADGAPDVPTITGATAGAGVSQYTWTTVAQDTLGVRVTHYMRFSHWEIDAAVTLDYSAIMDTILGVTITRLEGGVEAVLGCTVTGSQLVIDRVDTISGSSPFFLIVFGV